MRRKGGSRRLAARTTSEGITEVDVEMLLADPKVQIALADMNRLFGCLVKMTTQNIEATVSGLDHKLDKILAAIRAAGKEKNERM